VTSYPLFGRKGRLTIGDTSIEFGRHDQLRVVFDVAKMRHNKAQPNACDIQVYNLAERTRSKLDQVYDSDRGRLPFVLEAGYEASSGVIFRGKTTRIHSARVGPDLVTSIASITAPDASMKPSNIVIPKGTPTKEALAKFIDESFRDAGIAVKSAVATMRSGDLVGAGKTLLQGFIAIGDPTRLLQQAATDHGFDAWNDDEELFLAPIGEAKTEEIVDLNAASGLIGSPDRIPDDKRKKQLILQPVSLLRAEIQLGVKIRVATRIGAETANIVILVEEVHHNGDTHGEPWHTVARGAEYAPIAALAAQGVA
jgi:hypothetical protein